MQPIKEKRYMKPHIFQLVGLVLLLGSISFIVGEGRMLEIFESSLGMHMILEHALFFSIGIISIQFGETLLKFMHVNYIQNESYSKKVIKAWSGVLRAVYARMNGWLWLGFSIGLLGFWHMPQYFDLAASHELAHMLQHFSFIFVGGTGFLAARTFGDSFRIIILVVIIGMMGFSGLLFTVFDMPLYNTYSISDHQVAGAYMLITSVLLLVIGLPTFLIHKTLLYIRGKNLDMGS